MTWSLLFNSIFIICCSIAIVGFPFFILCFYQSNKRKFEEENWCEKFNAKYGTVYGHLKTDSKLLPRNAVIFLFSFFVFRRLIFALVIVFLEHRPDVQIPIMLLTCVVAVGYFTNYMPFVEPVYNCLHITNEVTLLILLNIMWWYKYMVGAPEVRWGLGWVVIVIIFLNLLMHLSYLLKQDVRAVKIVYWKRQAYKARAN